MTDRPQPEERRFDWANTQLDGHPVRFWILVALVITIGVIGFGAWWTTRSGSSQAAAGGMGDMTATGEVPVPPPVTGYYQGEEILFHPHRSFRLSGGRHAHLDDGVAGAGGTKARSGTRRCAGRGVRVHQRNPTRRTCGPFGYQPDIFDSAPIEPAYSPLRRVNLANWQPDATPRLLQSTDELVAAQDAGEVTITPTETVVNMPMLSWPTGHR